MDRVFVLLFLLGLTNSKECRHAGAELYLKAALKGYQNAQFNLGLYLLANGMLDVALFWFGKAAETGHAKACFNLGMHFKNTGDYCMAATYLTRAMRRNHEKAARKCVLMLPKAAKCPRALYLLGDAFKVRRREHVRGISRSNCYH